MKFQLARLLVPVCIMLLSLVVVVPSAMASGTAVFVDCDGDGFDDNNPDIDADGIPDEFEGHGFVSAPTGQLQASPMFTEAAPISDAQKKVGCGEAFGRRKFAARTIYENRVDFDACFGSELGMGGGLGAAGACVGGVCF